MLPHSHTLGNIPNLFIKVRFKFIHIKKGAILIKESDLDSQFKTVFNNLLSDENLQKELAINSKQLARPNATKDIVEAIIKLIK